MIREMCVCGHAIESHDSHWFSGIDRCYECFWESKVKDAIEHKFKLDNLQMIADIARDRELI